MSEQSVFRGIFEGSIDAKGRTSLPVKFREVLAKRDQEGRFFLSNTTPARLEGGELCFGLAIYPYDMWLELESKLSGGAGLDLSSAALAAVKRTIMAPAVECTTDKLGRILIPPHLRKNAALERQIVFVSSVDKAEIWSLERWERVNKQSHEDYPFESTALANVGL